MHNIDKIYGVCICVYTVCVYISKYIYIYTCIYINIDAYRGVDM